MAEEITKGVGMMQRLSVRYSMEDADDVDAISTTLAKLAAEQPKIEKQPQDGFGDAARRYMADQFREVLAQSGLVDDGRHVFNPAPLRKRGFEENSAQWIMSQWLASYHSLQWARRECRDGQATYEILAIVTFCAVELGKLEERMYWRAGIDPKTGKKPEALAVGKQKQELAIGKATEARRVHAEDTQPIWHDSATLAAHELRKKHPSYTRWRIAGLICQTFAISQGRCDKVLKKNGFK